MGMEGILTGRNYWPTSLIGTPNALFLVPSVSDCWNGHFDGWRPVSAPRVYHRQCSNASVWHIGGDFILAYVASSHSNSSGSSISPWTIADGRHVRSPEPKEARSGRLTVFGID